MMACVWAGVRVGVRVGVRAYRKAGVVQAGLRWCGREGVGIVCVVGGMTWRHDSVLSYLSRQ